MRANSKICPQSQIIKQKNFWTSIRPEWKHRHRIRRFFISLWFFIAIHLRQHNVHSCSVFRWLFGVSDNVLISIVVYTWDPGQGRVIVRRQVNHIFVFSQPPKSTQPGRPSAGRWIEYQWKLEGKRTHRAMHWRRIRGLAVQTGWELWKRTSAPSMVIGGAH